MDLSDAVVENWQIFLTYVPIDHDEPQFRPNMNYDELKQLLQRHHLLWKPIGFCFVCGVTKDDLKNHRRHSLCQKRWVQTFWGGALTLTNREKTLFLKVQQEVETTYVSPPPRLLLFCHFVYWQNLMLSVQHKVKKPTSVAPEDYKKAQSDSQVVRFLETQDYYKPNTLNSPLYEIQIKRTRVETLPRGASSSDTRALWLQKIQKRDTVFLQTLANLELQLEPKEKGVYSCTLCEQKEISIDAFHGHEESKGHYHHWKKKLPLPQAFPHLYAYFNAFQPYTDDTLPPPTRLQNFLLTLQNTHPQYTLRDLQQAWVKQDPTYQELFCIEYDRYVTQLYKDRIQKRRLEDLRLCKGRMYQCSLCHNQYTNRVKALIEHFNTKKHQVNFQNATDQERGYFLSHVGGLKLCTEEEENNDMIKQLQLPDLDPEKIQKKNQLFQKAVERLHKESTQDSPATNDVVSVSSTVSAPPIKLLPKKRIKNAEQAPLSPCPLCPSTKTYVPRKTLLSHIHTKEHQRKERALWKAYATTPQAPPILQYQTWYQQLRPHQEEVQQYLKAVQHHIHHWLTPQAESFVEEIRARVFEVPAGLLYLPTFQVWKEQTWDVQAFLTGPQVSADDVRVWLDTVAMVPEPPHTLLERHLQHWKPTKAQEFLDRLQEQIPKRFTTMEAQKTWLPLPALSQLHLQKTTVKEEVSHFMQTHVQPYTMPVKKASKKKTKTNTNQ